MISCSLHFGRFSFHRGDDFPSSKWKIKAIRSSLLPPSSPPCHNHASSNKTVTGNSGGRIISEMSHFGFECRFIKPWLCLTRDSPPFSCFPVFAQSKNISYSCFIPGLWFKKKKVLFFLSTFSALLANCLLGVMSQSNQWKTQFFKNKKEWHVNVVHCMCVSLFSALKCCDIWAIALSNERFCSFYSGQGVTGVELSRKQFCDFSNHPLSALPHLLSYWHAIFVDDLRLLGISGIHQEDCCHGDNGAKGRVK